MSDKKFISFSIGSVNTKKGEMYLSIPFFGRSTFKLYEPEEPTENGPAFVVLYAGNRVGSLWVEDGNENGPAYTGNVAFPAIYDGRFRFATLWVSVWPPDEEKNGKIRVTMSQIKDLDGNVNEDPDQRAEPAGLNMFNQAS